MRHSSQNSGRKAILRRAEPSLPGPFLPGHVLPPPSGSLNRPPPTAGRWGKQVKNLAQAHGQSFHEWDFRATLGKENPRQGFSGYKPYLLPCSPTCESRWRFLLRLPWFLDEASLNLALRHWAVSTMVSLFSALKSERGVGLVGWRFSRLGFLAVILCC